MKNIILFTLGSMTGAFLLYLFVVKEQHGKVGVLFLGHQFNGNRVLVEVDGDLSFYGRVRTEASSQLAARSTLWLKNEQIKLVVRVYSLQGTDYVSHEQCINISDGIFIIVMFFEGEIQIEQFSVEPEFY